MLKSDRGVPNMCYCERDLFRGKEGSGWVIESLEENDGSSCAAFLSSGIEIQCLVNLSREII